MQYRKIELKKQDKKIKYSTKDSLLDRLLLNRGLVLEDEIEEFLNPDKKPLISPYAFLDMKKAKDRILKAIEKKENILIWGDFDCDGVTSSTVLYKALKKLDAKVSVFIPDRLKDGHGLNSKELIKFISKDKIKLVITVDCATTNKTEVALLKSFKVDTIITDHHTVDDTIANAYAIINPQLKGALKEDLKINDITSLTYNSGSVVAYKLASALLEDTKDDDLKEELLVIAALGAIADVVPILGENRSMVSKALEILNTKHKPKAVYKLLSSQVQNEITSTNIAFILAPRINAVGRLAQAKTSFEFLNEENDSKIDLLIQELDNYNRIRQSKCNETYEEIIEKLKNDKSEPNNPAVVLINPDWHIGIIGIVAAKIVEEFNKPCFLMTVDENNNARCSIRSNDSINVYEVLKENQELFLGFGGHKLAGGCSFNLDEKDFETVKRAILKTISETKETKTSSNILYADVELSVNDLNIDIIESIKKLEPFGEANSQPVFMMKDVILSEYRVIGKEKNHLKMTFKKEDKIIDGIRFNDNELNVELNNRIDIAFFPSINEFNGKTSLQFEIIDIYSENLANKKAEFKVFDHRKKTDILGAIADYLKKDSLDIGIWANSQNIKQKLSNYETITKNIISDIKHHRGIMFFDYPSSFDELTEIISTINPEKIHFMNCSLDNNLENYIKQILGMVKYSSNKLEGSLDTKRAARVLAVSESFVQLALEILEYLGSIKIKENNKIEYIKPFYYEEFKGSSMFEVLKDEFDNILNFKETLLNCDIVEIEELVKSAKKTCNC